MKRSKIILAAMLAIISHDVNANAAEKNNTENFKNAQALAETDVTPDDEKWEVERSIAVARDDNNYGKRSNSSTVTEATAVSDGWDSDDITTVEPSAGKAAEAEAQLGRTTQDDVSDWKISEGQAGALVHANTPRPHKRAGDSNVVQTDTGPLFSYYQNGELYTKPYEYKGRDYHYYNFKETAQIQCPVGRLKTKVCP